MGGGRTYFNGGPIESQKLCEGCNGDECCVSVCWTGVVQGQVICYTNPSLMCGGPIVSPSPLTIRDCCLGNGFFYQLAAGDETCSQCVGEWSLDCCINNPC